MLDRRQWLTSTAAAATAATYAQSASAKASYGQDDLLQVGIMGLSRGMDLAKEAAKLPNVKIRYVCDTDQQRNSSAVNQLKELGQTPEPIGDFRRMLDDQDISAIFCAAPNHWHGPATILGCKAGKHVYCEKPCSHNPAEGEWMIEAAHKYSRCVQIGNQRRSSITTREAISKLHAGAIGQVYLARCNFARLRGSIGKSMPSDPPAYLDYELWQGPAPRRPYRDNVVHYQWHWFWHYGNGELGNNGPHCLDLCRWGLQVDYPIRVTSSGGRYCFDDDQETPDTHAVAYEFPGKKQITYHGVSCSQREAGPFVLFYGSDGTMEIDGQGGYTIFDSKNQEVEKVAASGWGQKEHVANFIEAVRANDPALLHQPVLEGHKSTLLCHLGNIAHRTQSHVDCDASNGHVLHKPDQHALWRRDYDPAWEKEITTI